MAFYSLPLKEGDRILTVEAEYVSNFLAFLHQARRRGLEIDVAPCDASGQVDLDALERLIGPKTRLIAVTHIPTQGGLVNPAEEIGKIARRHGITYLLDACQSVGQMPLDVEKIGCDLLSGTGRKFLRGPRGTGFLYASKRDHRPARPALHRPARRHLDRRAHVRAAPRCAPVRELGKLCRRPHRPARRRALCARPRPRADPRARHLLADRLRASLRRVARRQRPRPRPRALRHRHLHQEAASRPHIQARLRAAKIGVSVSSRSSAQLDFGRRGLSNVVRASVHYFNTEDEIETFCTVLSTSR